MFQAISKKTSGGSIVTIKTDSGVVIDSFPVPKFDGVKYCKETKGIFNARYMNAVQKIQGKKIQGRDINRHGSPSDRGRADSYYNRSYSPHYYTKNTMQSLKVSREFMTSEEIACYEFGYNENEELGDHKQWN